MKSGKPSKPTKPSPDFPLFPHDRGKWAKKIKGKLYYFGRWDAPDEALAEYQQFLADGCKKPNEPVSETLSESTTICMTVRDACNYFLVAREKDLASKQLSHRSFADYKRTGERLVAFFGRERAFTTLGPQDFTAYRARVLETNNPVSTGNEITRVKTILKWLKKSHYIDDFDCGPDFRKPSAKVARRLRREKGKKLFTAKQISVFLDEAGIHLRAMILLGINCGYGNNDCNQLPLRIAQEAVETGWIEYHRPKTEVDRRCPLWPETKEALAKSLARRRVSSEPNAFITAFGRPYSAENGDIGKRFRIVRQYSNVREGGFYWLRHTFATVAGRSQDQVAVNYIMGHVDPTMAGVYREEIEDERLMAVSETVKNWLQPPG